MVDGAPFRFVGANDYGLALDDGRPENDLYETMRQYASRGFKVVRFWGFSCAGGFYGNPIVLGATSAGPQYSESALRRLDVALDAARAAGLKVIMPLSNGRPEYCSPSWWANAVTGQSDASLFYSDWRVRQVYRQHLTTILRRVNTRIHERTGTAVQYKDDPTLFSIELENEPTLPDWVDRRMQLRDGELVNAWLREMSDHVRGEDTKHLITSGEEGYKASPGAVPNADRSSWIHDGSKGVDFERNVALPNIDVATIHVFPQNWAIPTGDFWWLEYNVVRDRAQIAHGLGKPIIMEETGFAELPELSWLGYDGSRAYWLGRMFQMANEADYAGTMVWQALPSGRWTGGYDFTFDAPEFQQVETQIRHINGP